MSWFNRGGPLRTSLRRSHSPSLPRNLDTSACLESFKNHWQQVLEIITKQGSQSRHVRGDNVRAVMNHVDQMVTLLLHDVQVSNEGMGPILDCLLTEDILDKIFLWSTKLGENVNAFKLEQLKLYEVLISHSHQPLLIHKPILTPLLKLLQTCGECGPVEVEKRLVILLNQLCVSLTQNATLMDFFFSISLQQSPSKFLIFNLLIPFVHREGGIGQQARDALLLCMSLSRTNESMGHYIAEHSNFCPILATGLSGLYSLLPRKLVIETEDWHQLTPEDIHDIPELAMFMNSFEFCNAVIQVSYPMVQEQLLEYLYQGFLVPVLGPALHQGNVSVPIENVDWPEYCSSSADEIITATAYLDLFLRTITEASLLQTFLRFIFNERHEGALIIDTIISRLAIQTRQMCLVTLALFRTLLELNCEDVMFQLVFRYLIPCTHVMVSQRCRIKNFDIYCKTAEKFLALIPACCQPEGANSDHSSPRQGSPVQHGQGAHRRSFTVPDVDTMQKQQLRQQQLDAEYQLSYLDYLQEAHRGIVRCMESCSVWKFPYDGENPSPEQFRNFVLNKGQLAAAMLSEDDLVDGVINANANENDCDTRLKNLPQEKTPDGSANGVSENDVANKTSSNALLNSEVQPDAPSEKTDLASSKSNTSDETTDSENEIPSSPADNDVEMDEDELFWAKLERCQTPPPSNIEESFHEIDSAYGWLEMKAYKSHSFSNSPQKVIGQDFVESFGAKALDVMENASVVELRLQPEATVPITGSTSQEKPSLLAMHGYSESFGEPDTGPFLGMLFNKLENMMNNNLYINLQLTGVIARLAYFPQPLLRSFLLNHTLVFQPTVRSLLQILGSLKHKLDNYSSTIDNFHNLLCRARKFLKAREERLSFDNGSTTVIEPGRRRSSSPDGHKENKRRSFADIIFRKPATGEKDKNMDVTLDGISDGTGYRYINRPFPDAPDGKLESLKTKNAVLCAVVLEEFLKELSAITQEHILAEIQDENLDSLFSESFDVVQ